MTVMLAIVFLTATGSLALYLTYTSMQVAASDRIIKEVSYNANSYMEEIKAGVQDIVSDAIKETYSVVMPIYNSKAGDVSDIFSDTYFSYIASWPKQPNSTEYIEGRTGITPLFTLNKNTATGKYTDGTYSTDAIEALVKEKRNPGDVQKFDCIVESVSSEDAENGVAEIVYKTRTEIGEDGNEHEVEIPDGVILRGVKVTCKGKENRTSSVTADIRIGIPNIGYLFTQYAITGIPEFTFICGGEFKQDVSQVNKGATIQGSAFAGSMNLQNNTTLRVYDGTLICAGDIKVKGKENGNSRFDVSSNSSLWAKNIEIGPETKIKLSGKTYVNNDLVFNGNNAEAELGGTYYGFGTGAKYDNDGNYLGFIDSKSSSSIISNRPGAKLNISKLNELKLAGVSFITNDNRTVNAEEEADYRSAVMMGEAVSGKLNQELYLAPYDSVNCVKYYHPLDTLYVCQKCIDDKLDDEEEEFDVMTLQSENVGFGLKESWKLKCPKCGKVDSAVYREIDGEIVLVCEKSKGGCGYAAPWSRLWLVCPKCNESGHATEYMIYYQNESGTNVELNKLSGEYSYFKYQQAQQTGEDGEPLVDEEGNPVMYDTNNRIDVDAETFKPKTYTESLNEGRSKQSIITMEEFLDTAKYSLKPDSETDFGKPFTDYGAYLKPLFRYFNGEYLVWFFIDFDTQDHANAYFRDYFNYELAAGRSKIINNLNHYINFGDMSNTRITAVGSYYTYDENGRLKPVAAPSVTAEIIREEADFLADIYKNYCVYLTNVPGEDLDGSNPFENIVWEDEIDKLFEDNPTESVFKFYSRDLNTAVIVNGNFTYNKTNYPDLCLIVATGNVTIPASYSGLIVCKGDVIVTSSAAFTTDADAVITAFASDSEADVRQGTGYKKIEGEAFKNYFRADILEEFQSTESRTAEAWNVAKLVTFESWSR